MIDIKQFKTSHGTNDRGILREVIELDCYGIKNINIDSGNIIDIGGQIGSFSVLAADKFPGCQIYSYEMLKENFDLLKINTESYKNIKIFNAAIIGDNRAGSMYIHPKNTGGHCLIFNGENNVDVEQINIKDIIEDKEIELLKSDCEGSEFEIFRAIEKYNLFKNIKRIVMETHEHSGNDSMEIENMLTRQGYKFKVYINPGDKKLKTILAFKD